MKNGCTRHMVNRQEYFNIFEAVQEHKEAENQEIMKAEELASVDEITVVIGMIKRNKFHDVLCVPHLVYNLIYISHARRKDIVSSLTIVVYQFNTENRDVSQKLRGYPNGWYRN